MRSYVSGQQKQQAPSSSSWRAAYVAVGAVGASPTKADDVVEASSARVRPAKACWRPGKAKGEEGDSGEPVCVLSGPQSIESWSCNARVPRVAVADDSDPPQRPLKFVEALIWKRSQKGKEKSIEARIDQPCAFCYFSTHRTTSLHHKT